MGRCMRTYRAHEPVHQEEANSNAQSSSPEPNPETTLFAREASFVQDWVERTRRAREASPRRVNDERRLPAEFPLEDNLWRVNASEVRAWIRAESYRHGIRHWDDMPRRVAFEMARVEIVMERLRQRLQMLASNHTRGRRGRRGVDQ
ncbi:hypothetical protein NLI96_g2561 [Meripilus lineatus]|uniref:Uncharacterized protein n=1 Tax=Meripilus lineatus TaxID=2056292 RepID=A0AAD5YLR9_9APHY|nr:hypothetical protein NLI96_g2561 [Physisporinus lineatus]